MKQRVGIIGKFGAKEKMYDGQTIKTKNLAMLLEGAGYFPLVRVDTCYFRKNNIKLMLDSLWCILICKHIFLMVSVNGMKFYLPFLFYINKIFHRRVYHYVIGSELLEMVKENPRLIKYLNDLTVNWFEYDSGTQYLLSQGIKNACTLPNFKLITPVKEPLVYSNNSGIFSFCTFSRVMEEKGITDAIDAVSRINEEQGKVIATLDIYGQIEPNYASKLNELLAENPKCVAYKGIVDSQSSVDVLKNYFALVFPTRWSGEGLPGTIIDAFAAGIPVIASDWNANKEIIQHYDQGIIYPNSDMVTLKDAMFWSIQHNELMEKMRINSRKAVERYTPEAVLQVILSEIKKN